MSLHDDLVDAWVYMLYNGTMTDTLLDILRHWGPHWMLMGSPEEV